jgi:hypothetical protein
MANYLLLIRQNRLMSYAGAGGFFYGGAACAWFSVPTRLGYSG